MRVCRVSSLGGQFRVYRKGWIDLDSLDVYCDHDALVNLLLRHLVELRSATKTSPRKRGGKGLTSVTGFGRHGELLCGFHLLKLPKNTRESRRKTS